MGLWRYCVAIIVGVALLSAAQSLAAGSRLMQASAKFQRLGDYWISDDPSYSGAIKALGAPSSCHLVDSSPSHVTASWRVARRPMDLVTLGGVPSGKTGCTAPTSIQVFTVRVTGKQWFDVAQLRVGDPVAKLHRLYPRALVTSGVTWLVPEGLLARDASWSLLGRLRRQVVRNRPGPGCRTSAVVSRASFFVIGAQGE